MDAIRVQDLYDLTHTAAKEMLSACEYPWQALARIKAAVLQIGEGLSEAEYDHPAQDVWIAKSASIAPTASITGPCIIGPDSEVRPGAFLRGSILVGDGAETRRASPRYARSEEHHV